MVIFGLTGHGKTQLGLTMAVAIIKGSNFLDQEAFPCRQGRVAYITTDDMGLNEVQMKFKGVDAILNPLERDDLLHIHFDENVDITHLSDDVIYEWVKAIHEFEPIVVFVDVISGTHFMDENKGETPPTVYGAWRKLLGEAPAIVYLMHSRKADREGKDDPLSSLSGHHGWGDKVSSMLHTAKVRRHESYFVLNFPKVRGAGWFKNRDQGFICQMDDQTRLFRVVERVEKKSSKAEGPLDSP